MIYIVSIVDEDTGKTDGKFIVVRESYDYGEGVIKQITHPLDSIEKARASLKVWKDIYKEDE